MNKARTESLREAQKKKKNDQVSSNESINSKLEKKTSKVNTPQ